MVRGKLITFEGIEGCGKSTQAALLAEYLTSRGEDVLLTREPGGTAIGESIRSLLLHSKSGQLAPDTELLLFLSARAQLIADIVVPALEAGRTVILDRYIHSTLAYQCFGTGYFFGREIDEDVIEQARKFCYQSARDIRPDLVILVDVSVQVGMTRISNREHDGIEMRGAAYFNKVRDGFLQLAKDEPDIFAIINGEQDIPEIAEDIEKVMNNTN